MVEVACQASSRLWQNYFSYVLSLGITVTLNKRKVDPSQSRLSRSTPFHLVQDRDLSYLARYLLYFSVDLWSTCCQALVCWRLQGRASSICSWKGCQSRKGLDTLDSKTFFLAQTYAFSRLTWQGIWFPTLIDVLERAEMRLNRLLSQSYAFLSV